ncbi:hypothetical protein BJ123_14515 [Rhodopseudomonas thermotolerans]|uniref:DUF2946 family protein n=2 Tax=Rhodopseudomonas TaxID=1073 RepID=A0A336K663_9BRAD|nr:MULTISPECIES: hypothetical protein [Rhodopseudomonas]RED21702.1 hypothetical protein BJ125_14515 [Rhodopseudomonas pentothenatexigens]REF88215.1 hypothetical protein BJ123_14515 [Rhodopseudomonas thermotolerans]SSW93631.1 hypothetical protein SAMN05892882_14515 [Rhodopseudomonas pentothenatexigens]
MSWVRTNIRWGARLALIALALQFALSFGHIHVHDLERAAIAETASVTGPTTPDSDHHPGGATDLCAVCAVVAMAGSALDAAPPTLPQQQAHAFHYRLSEAGSAEPSSPSGAFQPRAPPLS